MTAEDREIARTAPAWWTGADVGQTELPPIPSPYLEAYAKATIAAERGRADAAERDARRWRWLAPRLLSVDWEYGDPPTSVVTFRWPVTQGVSAAFGECVDAAIDAATEGVQHGEAK